MFDLLWRSIAIGIGATILMDIWAVVLGKLTGSGLPNWGPPGRWVWHLREGKVFHDDIAHAAPYATRKAGRDTNNANDFIFIAEDGGHAFCTIAPDGPGFRASLAAGINVKTA